MSAPPDTAGISAGISPFCQRRLSRRTGAADGVAEPKVVAVIGVNRLISVFRSTVPSTAGMISLGLTGSAILLAL